MNVKGKIKIFGRTDVGLLRDHNEDTIACDDSIGLAVLADGMGGHRGGEMASAMTINTIMEILTQKLKYIRNAEVDKESGYRMESIAIYDAIIQANKNVYQSSQEHAQYRGMGTTVVVLLFYDNRYTVAHVGDSRLYLLRNGILEQVTRDHSLMQELIDRNFYTPEQARNSLNKNLITRAVGIDKKVQIDIQEDIAMIDDIFLLCSDGVNDMIEDTLIQSILEKNDHNLESAADELIHESILHGGKDNISAILARPVKTFPAKNNLFSCFFDIFS